MAGVLEGGGQVRAMGAVRGGGGEGGVAGLLFMAGALEGGGKCEQWGPGLGLGMDWSL